MGEISRSQRNTREASGLTSISGRTNCGQGGLSDAPVYSLGPRFRQPLTGAGFQKPAESGPHEAGPQWDWVGGMQSTGWRAKDP